MELQIQRLVVIMINLKYKVAFTDSPQDIMGHVMRKPTFCISEDKGAADQRLCFRYIESTIRLLPKFEIFCGCTAWFVLDLVENPKTGFLVTCPIYLIYSL